MIVPKTLNQQTELTEDELDEMDSYQFWGMVQTVGEVCPINIDHCLYYTPSAVNQAPSIEGLPLRVDHIAFENDPEMARVGEVVDERVFQDNLYGLHELRRDDWDGFVSFVEEENGNIGLTFNQLIREIHAGNLGLSAGLDVGASETPIHDFTVLEIRDWDEVSLVGVPASPGSWAWACDGACDIVFDQQMSTQSLDVDLETLQQSADGDGELPGQIAEVLDSDQSHGVYISPDRDVEVVEEHPEQSGCDECSDHEQEIEKLKQERDKYKELVEEIEQERREEVSQRLREVNDKIPEDEQYAEEELEDFIEQSSVSHLEQTADMLEKLARSNQSSFQSDEEDLNGAGNSGSNEQVEEAKQQVDKVTRDLFGKDADTVFQEIEEGKFGE